jgi:predicted amidophosphoribosyltransferase
LHTQYAANKVLHMEKLCRACGSELAAVDLCEGCGEPVRWLCKACLKEKDSSHVHRAVVQYVITR